MKVWSKTIHKFTTQILFHPHENQAQMMGWHGWSSTHMITTVSSKKGSICINIKAVEGRYNIIAALD